MALIFLFLSNSNWALIASKDFAREVAFFISIAFIASEAGSQTNTPGTR
jgi:hypothetical protein